MKYKILISSINGPLGYELVKYLKKYFYILGCDSQSYGLGSKICDEFHLCPHGNSKDFLIFLNEINPRVNQFFLFADEEILNLSQNRHKYKEVILKTLISSHETINLCNNKLQLKKYLKNYFTLPKEKAKKIIIKPLIGRGSKNQIILTENISKFYKTFNEDRNFFIEEFIEGKEYTIDCVYNFDNKLIYALIRERIIKSSLSVVGKIIKDKKIIEFIKQLSKRLDFIGNVNIQVIVNKKNKIYLTDINPRVSGSIIFSIKAGFNPFTFAKQILNNKITKPPSKIKYGKTYYRYWKTFKD